ncbi:MAG: type II secretion system minor pseudopilin GspK [Verrucomicrobiota bacterium]
MSRSRDSERGIALLVTLLILVLVLALANEIFRLGARAAQTSAYGRDSIRCGLLAEAGTAAARIALRQDARQNTFDTLDELWSREAPPFDLGDGTIRVTVEDEERKLNLNLLVLPNGNAPDENRLAEFRLLLSHLGLDPALADAVVDWLDNDDSPRVGGAESSYYEALPYPYRAKNDLFDSIDELRLVRGFSKEVFEKVRPFVTVTSSGKVNINTAPKEVLMSLSAGEISAGGGAIDESAANQLIAYRLEHPFRRPEDIGNVSPFFQDLYRKTRLRDLIDVRSTMFHVRAAGEVGDTVRTVDAIGLRTGNEVKWQFWRIE